MVTVSPVLTSPTQQIYLLLESVATPQTVVGRFSLCIRHFGDMLCRSHLPERVSPAAALITRRNGFGAAERRYQVGEKFVAQAYMVHQKPVRFIAVTSNDRVNNRFMLSGSAAQCVGPLQLKARYGASRP